MLLTFILIAKSWNIFLYMNADNSLSTVVDLDLEEIRKANVAKDINVVVMLDKREESTYLFHLQNHNFSLLASLGELDMGSPQTLVYGARLAHTYFPSENYGIVVWNHGNAWREELKAISIDESSGNSIGVAGGELRDAFSEIKRIIGKKLKFVLLDACAMGTLEVAFELKTAAQVMFASESLVTVYGLPYDVFLNTFSKNRDKDIQVIATKIIEAVGEYYKTQDYNQFISAIDLSKLENCVEELNFISEFLKGNISLLREIRKKSKGFSIEASETDFIDLLDFSQKCEKIGGVKKLKGIEESIIKAYPWGGIGVWFPLNWIVFKYNYEEYQKLYFTKRVKWLPLLFKFYGVHHLPLPSPIFKEPSIKNNSIFLSWEESKSLNEVKYELYESKGMEKAMEFSFEEDSPLWELSGFTSSDFVSYQGTRSLFSGIQDGYARLKNQINQSYITFFYNSWLGESFDTSSFKLFSNKLYVEVSKDGKLWIPIDSISGKSKGWEKMSLLCPFEDVFLRLRYENQEVVGSGIYIDDFRIFSLDSLREISSMVKSNSFTLYNKKRGDYFYFVRALDEFGNSSSYDFCSVKIKEYAIPYTIPSPFSNYAKVILDYPEGEEGTLFIYSISGKLLRKFELKGEKKIEINGRDFPDGLYILILKTRSIERVGKTAKVN